MWFVFEMEIVGYAEISSVYKWSVFFIVFFIIIIILGSLMESLEAPSRRFLEHGKWFAPIC